MLKKRLFSLVAAGVLAVGAIPVVAEAKLEQACVDFLTDRNVDPELVAAIQAAATEENESGPNSYNQSIQSLMRQAVAYGWSDAQVESYLRGMYNTPTTLLGPRPISSENLKFTGEEVRAKIEAFTRRFEETSPEADVSADEEGMALWVAEPFECKLLVNGEEVKGEYFMLKNRTLAPADVFVGLGCQVSFDPETLTGAVTYEDRTVELIPGLPALHTEEGYILTEFSPKIAKDQLYVPVRAVAESLGIPVDWDGAVILGSE